MNLFKWKTNKRPQFPKVIEKFFGKNIRRQAAEGEEIATVPSVNISQANKAFEVEVAVPGLDKKDVKIDVAGNRLIISSEKQYSNEEKQKHWVRKEYGYAAFQRMFELPPNADPEAIDAKMKNGVLRIKVGKKPGTEETIKRIEVT